METQRFVLPDWAKTAWKWLRWPLGIAAAIYIALFVWGLYLHGEQYATEDAIAYINSQRLTLADARGDNLPPAPDAADTTLEGQDQNLNGIRDDVELKIFEMYPDDIKARAGALQYAKALRLYLTKYVFNSETLVAAINQAERGNFCLSSIAPKWDSNTPQTEVTEIIFAQQALTQEIEDLVFNTEQRKQRRSQVFDRYMTSYTSWKGENCDVNAGQI